MSLNATLSNALSGLAAAKRSLSVTSNNISNANTPGYTAKKAELASRVVDGRGAGVRVEDERRVVDDFLSAELRRQESRLAHSERLLETHKRVELTVFGEPGSADRGMPARLRELTEAAENLANNPDSDASRAALVGSVDDALTQLQGDFATVHRLRGDLDQEIARTVTEVNGSIGELHRLNQEIVRAGPTPALLDRRDAALSSLSSKIDVSVGTVANGQVAIYAPGGQALLEYTPRTLAYTPSSAVVDGATFNPIVVYDESQVDEATGQPKAGAVGADLVSGGVRAQLTPELLADAVADTDQLIVSPLRGGELAALIEARDKLLPELSDQLKETGVALEYALNRAHNRAVPHPPPRTASGPVALGSVSAVAGSASFVVVDADGATVADLTIDLTALPLPPVPATANDVAAVVVAELNAQLTGAGLGTATFDPVTGETQVSLGVDGGGRPYGLALDAGDSELTLGDDAGHSLAYGAAHFLGLNNLIVRGRADGVELKVRGDIAADPNLLSGVTVDRGTGSAVVGGAGDSSGLRGLAEALDERVPTVRRGQVDAGERSVSELITDVFAAQAASHAQAERRESADRALVEDLRYRQGSISGVNLDEELARLQLYQQAYAVSARVITVVDELLEQLMNMAR